MHDDDDFSSSQWASLDALFLANNVDSELINDWHVDADDPIWDFRSWDEPWPHEPSAAERTCGLVPGLRPLDVIPRRKRSQRPERLPWVAFEVADSDMVSAADWFDLYGDVLVQAGITANALDWEFSRRPGGIVFVIVFSHEAAQRYYVGSDVVQRALEERGPLGLTVSQGPQGGSAGVSVGRRRPPSLGSGAASLSVPLPWSICDYAAAQESSTTRIGLMNDR